MTGMSQAWDDCEALPERGSWVLEASAGTGKTHQIASIYLRLVAEYGLDVEKLLVMTFTNAATAELKDRIRRRLQAAFDVLDGGGTPKADDRVMTHLLTTVPAADLKRRLLVGLRAFDRASISTIHGFSQRVLGEFAFESGQDAGVELLESVHEVKQQVVDDALATLYSLCDEPMVRVLQAYGLGREALFEIAKAVGGTEPYRVEPAPPVLPGPGWVSVWQPALDAVAPLLAGVAAFRERYFERGRARDEVRGALRAALPVDLAEAALRALEEWVADEGGLVRLPETRQLNLNAASAAALRGFCSGISEGGVAAVLQGRPWANKRPLKSWIPEDAWPLVTASAGEVDLIHAGHLTTRLGGSITDSLLADFVASYTSLRELVDEFRFSRTFSPLAGFAAVLRDRIEAEVRRRRALTFDAMIARLADRVAGGAGDALVERLRGRYQAVLVDEFQDTDAAQWGVLERVFLGHARLFLIGDPKQAIYAFRGANVHVYVRAKELIPAASHRTMAVNWRSDAVAVDAMNHLWREGSNAFDLPAGEGGPGFDYVEVSASPGRGQGRAPGLEVVWVPEATEKTSHAVMCRRVMGLLQHEVLSWLRAEGRGIEGKDRVFPRDLAVLVSSHREAVWVRRALEQVGVPVVSASKGTVLESPPARWLVHWLQALADPRSEKAARTAASTPLGGWSAEQLAWSLAVGSDAPGVQPPAGIHVPDWAAWRAHVKAVSESFAAHGFSRAFDEECIRLAVFERLLALPDGERHATDLRHLAELVDAHDKLHRPSAAALAEWLLEQGMMRERDEESDGGVWSQRLESDAAAVTIETVHASKGLQYPVVLLPFAWAAREVGTNGPLKRQGPDGAIIDLSTPGAPARSAAIDAAAAEARREALRKLYVALTRAKHRTVAWWGPAGKVGGKDSDHTPLGRLLLRRPGTSGFLPQQPLDAEAVRERLGALAEASLGSITCAPAGEERPITGRYQPAATTTRVTLPAPVTRSPWTPWARTSFSSLVPDDHLRDVDDGPAAPRREARPAGVPAPSGVRPLSGALPLAKGAGKDFGSFVHGVLEDVEFAPPDPHALRRSVARRAREYRIGEEAAAELVAHLPQLLATPLDGGETSIARDWSLSRLARADRLDELEFDLRLGAGERWVRGEGAVADLAGLWRALREAPVPAAWVASLAQALSREVLVGILNGKIDLVFRAPCEDGRRRYFLADYKTNLIGPTLGHYDRPWLEWKMAEKDYLLQSLLYTVALHRHLGSRLAGYDYEHDVGGYQFLFLRGMLGVDTPRMGDDAHAPRHGVFTGRWPGHVIEAVDRALSGVGR